MKNCPACNKPLPETDFYPRYAKCKKCLKLHRQPKAIIPEGYARCFVCEEILLDIEENFLQNRPSYRKSTMCKSCQKDKRAEIKFKIENDLIQHREPKPDVLKCKDCEGEFPFTEKFFHKQKNMPYGLMKRCKVCQHNLVEAREYERNPEKDAQRRINAIEHRRTIIGRSEMIAGLENRRARKNNVFVEEVTAQDIEGMIWFQEGCCFYCHETILETFELDHMEPISNNGKHELSNCVVCCGKCNRSKGAKSYQDWLLYLEKFILKR